MEKGKRMLINYILYYIITLKCIGRYQVISIGKILQ